MAKEDPESKNLWQELIRIEDKAALEKLLTEQLQDYPRLDDLKKHIFSVYDDLFYDTKKLAIDFRIPGTIVKKLNQKDIEELILEMKKGANDFEKALKDYIRELKVKVITKEVELYLCRHPRL